MDCCGLSEENKYIYIDLINECNICYQNYHEGFK